MTQKKKKNEINRRWQHSSPEKTSLEAIDRNQKKHKPRKSKTGGPIHPDTMQESPSSLSPRPNTEKTKSIVYEESKIASQVKLQQTRE